MDETPKPEITAPHDVIDTIARKIKLHEIKSEEEKKNLQEFLNFDLQDKLSEWHKKALSDTTDKKNFKKSYQLLTHFLISNEDKKNIHSIQKERIKLFEIANISKQDAEKAIINPQNISTARSYVEHLLPSDIPGNEFQKVRDVYVSKIAKMNSRDFNKFQITYINFTNEHPKANDTVKLKVIGMLANGNLKGVFDLVDQINERKAFEKRNKKITSNIETEKNDLQGVTIALQKEKEIDTRSKYFLRESMQERDIIRGIISKFQNQSKSLENTLLDLNRSEPTYTTTLHIKEISNKLRNLSELISGLRKEEKELLAREKRFTSGLEQMKWKIRYVKIIVEAYKESINKGFTSINVIKDKISQFAKQKNKYLTKGEESFREQHGTSILKGIMDMLDKIDNESNTKSEKIRKIQQEIKHWQATIIKDKAELLYAHKTLEFLSYYETDDEFRAIKLKNPNEKDPSKKLSLENIDFEAMGIKLKTEDLSKIKYEDLDFSKAKLNPKALILLEKIKQLNIEKDAMYHQLIRTFKKPDYWLDMSIDRQLSNKKYDLLKKKIENLTDAELVKLTGFDKESNLALLEEAFEYRKIRKDLLPHQKRRLTVIMGSDTTRPFKYQIEDLFTSKFERTKQKISTIPDNELKSVIGHSKEDILGILDEAKNYKIQNLIIPAKHQEVINKIIEFRKESIRLKKTNALTYYDLSDLEILVDPKKSRFIEHISEAEKLVQNNNFLKCANLKYDSFMQKNTGRRTKKLREFIEFCYDHDLNRALPLEKQLQIYKLFNALHEKGNLSLIRNLRLKSTMIDKSDKKMVRKFQEKRAQFFKKFSEMITGDKRYIHNQKNLSPALQEYYNYLIADSEGDRVTKLEIATIESAKEYEMRSFRIEAYQAFIKKEELLKSAKVAIKEYKTNKTPNNNKKAEKAKTLVRRKKAEINAILNNHDNFLRKKEIANPPKIDIDIYRENGKIMISDGFKVKAYTNKEAEKEKTGRDLSGAQTEKMILENTDYIKSNEAIGRAASDLQKFQLLAYNPEAFREDNFHNTRKHLSKLLKSAQKTIKSHQKNFSLYSEYLKDLEGMEHGNTPFGSRLQILIEQAEQYKNIDVDKFDVILNSLNKDSVDVAGEKIMEFIQNEVTMILVMVTVSAILTPAAAGLTGVITGTMTRGVSSAALQFLIKAGVKITMTAATKAAIQSGTQYIWEQSIPELRGRSNSDEIILNYADNFITSLPKAAISYGLDADTWAQLGKMKKLSKLSGSKKFSASLGVMRAKMNPGKSFFKIVRNLFKGKLSPQTEAAIQTLCLSVYKQKENKTFTTKVKKIFEQNQTFKNLNLFTEVQDKDIQMPQLQAIDPTATHLRTVEESNNRRIIISSSKKANELFAKLAKEHNGVISGSTCTIKCKIPDLENGGTKELTTIYEKSSKERKQLISLLNTPDVLGGLSPFQIFDTVYDKVQFSEKEKGYILQGKKANKFELAQYLESIGIITEKTATSLSCKFGSNKAIKFIEQ